MSSSYSLDKVVPLIIGYCEKNKDHAATMFDNFTPQHFNGGAKLVFKHYRDHFLTTNTLPSHDLFSVVKFKNSQEREQVFEFLECLKEFDLDSCSVHDVQRMSKLLYKQLRRMELLQETMKTLGDKDTLNEHSIERADTFLRDGLILSQSFSEETVTDFDTDLPQLLKEIASPESRKVVRTGFPTLDTALGGGLSESTLTLLATRTSGGKTATMLNMAFRQAENGHNVLFITLEDTKKSLYHKYLALRFDEQLGDIGSIHRKDRIKVVARIMEKMKSPNPKSGKLIILDKGEKEFQISDLRQAVLDYQNQEIDVIYLDYLGKLTPPDGMNSSTLYEKGKAYAAGLRRLSIETKIPIVTASQTTRESLKKSITDLELDAISESSAITHTADFIGILSGQNDETRLYNNERFLKIIKNKVSRCSDEILSFYWDMETLKIFDDSEFDKWIKYASHTEDDREINSSRASGRAA